MEKFLAIIGVVAIIGAIAFVIVAWPLIVCAGAYFLDRLMGR